MSERSSFFRKIRKDRYTIILPDMLPYHIWLLAEVFTKHGYRSVVASAKGREVSDEGLKAIHNDACYPALLVTGQYLRELKSGRYDLSRTAVMITQTGGGCRASNYLSLIRKALSREFPQVPVISLNASRLEKNRSLPISLPMLLQMLAAVLYGDLIMCLEDQIRPYERKKGSSAAAAAECMEWLRGRLSSGFFAFLALRKNYRMIIGRFRKIMVAGPAKPKVGIVGEIYVKYSSLANNNLKDFLIRENCQPVEPSLMEFILYSLSNSQTDYSLYRQKRFIHLLARLGSVFLSRLASGQAGMVSKSGLKPFDSFRTIAENSRRIISRGVKMGEGWLIPSEMLTMADRGCLNIVCVQPFGCLPNHIVGKGMIRPLRKICPKLNIAPIDYDPGASRVNQENRIKLMLSNISPEDNE